MTGELQGENMGLPRRFPLQAANDTLGSCRRGQHCVGLKPPWPTYGVGLPLDSVAGGFGEHPDRPIWKGDIEGMR
jgi:hypothetical protein